MNEPRIGGVEPPETTPVAPSANPPASPEVATIPVESNPKPKINRVQGLVGLLLAIVAIMIAGAAGYYVRHLQKQVIQLQFRLSTVQAVARDASEKVAALKIPKDLTPEINSLEISINKLRTADDIIRKNLADEVQKIPAIETRLSEANRALAARLGDTESMFRQLRDRNEGRLTNIIAILKNQDHILRRLAPPSASVGEQP